MGPKDLLHHINNQLEIIVSAAALVNLRSTDLQTGERCAEIRSAVFRASALLNAYFKEPIPNATAGNRHDRRKQPRDL